MRHVKPLVYESGNPAARASEHRFQHHRPRHGHRQHDDRRQSGRRRHHARDRIAGRRRFDLQLHLLELLLPAHGHERTDGAGLRREEPPRMHRHAGAHAARRGRIGRTDPAAAIPARPNGDLGHERRRTGRRILLRPHLGRTGGHHALRPQRLVHRDAERPHPHVDRHSAKRRPCRLFVVLRLPLRDGHRRHRLRLGRRPVPRRGAGRRADRGQLSGVHHAHRLVGGLRHAADPALSGRQPRHHRPHALHRSRLHLLHRRIGPHGGSDAAGRQHHPVAAVHPLLLHDRRFRAGGRGAHGTVHRRTRRAVAAPLHPQLDLLVAGRRGGLRRHLPRLVARPAARLHPEQPTSSQRQAITSAGSSPFRSPVRSPF